LVNTPKLLDELKRAGISATFFVVGKNLETPHGKELLQRAAAEGHQIRGSHSLTPGGRDFTAFEGFQRHGFLIRS
jgi:peptidoglycan/xylan/chitin deacetylase (PgdA/CDA1 family)